MSFTDLPQDSPQLSSSRSSPSVQGEFVEFTKDGSVSRMRSHKGNVPSLPQTKLCPLCPAKFTRTTHLNRHLRTHSNERMHECDRCQAQFTRSDLLSRHKRSCGDPSHSHRSRRKSCMACAESKVKCDQKQPCSKCKSRGRECLYQNVIPDAVKKTSGRAKAPSSYNKVEFSSDSVSLSSSPYTTASTSPQFEASEGTPTVPKLDLDDTDFSASSSYASSSFASEATDRSESSAPSFAREALEVQNHLNALFSTEMFDRFFHSMEDNTTPDFAVDDIFQMTASPTSYVDTDTNFPFSTSIQETQPFMAGVDPYNFAGFEGLLNSSLSSRSTSPGLLTHSPQPSDLRYYMYLFSTKFLEQMPFIHLPTFDITTKPHILINAMQACGALYVKTPVATNFIQSTLASAREEIAAAFDPHPTRSEDQIHLILAVCLLQTIGLFHQRGEQRAQSNRYHAMLVMMIRQSGMLEHTANYVPPTLNQHTDIHAAWVDWVCYETTKRTLTLTFLHDCCHSIFFTLRPTFAPQEFNLPGPCEESLWKANSAEEWRLALLQPSPYGSISSRLQGGLPIQSSLAILATMPTTTDPQPTLILNPFSQFILIHAILRNLFEDCIRVKKHSSTRVNFATNISSGSQVTQAQSHLQTQAAHPSVWDGTTVVNSSIPQASITTTTTTIPQTHSSHSSGTSHHHPHQPRPRQAEEGSQAYPLPLDAYQPYPPTTPSRHPRTKSRDYTNVNPTIQYMLHNWLQGWFQSPETPRFQPSTTLSLPSSFSSTSSSSSASSISSSISRGVPSSNLDNQTDPPFFFDALPFYWIAQVLLLAYQEGLPPFQSGDSEFDCPSSSTTSSSEAKYRLMKQWFKHVRGFLRNGEQGPTLFWDELMKIRMRSMQNEAQQSISGGGGIHHAAYGGGTTIGGDSHGGDAPGGDGDGEGLIGFFASR